MLSLTKRYSFAASHRLYSADLTDEENQAVYGKCANPYGHGHNYEIEITVSGPLDPLTGTIVSLAALDSLAEDQILTPFRFRDLNQEVPAFASAVPTAENIAREADRRLRASWSQAFPGGNPRLEKLRIRETPRNICEI